MDKELKNKVEKSKKSQSKKVEFPTFPAVFQGLALTVTVGLALAAKPWRPIVQAAVARPMSVFDFLWAFAIVTILVLLLIRWRLGPKVFSGLFLLAIFFGVIAIGMALAGEVGAIICFVVAVILHYGLGRVWSFDLILVVGLAGVAFNLGQAMHPTTAAIILAVLSLYDVIAVYSSRHMVKMAKRLSAGGAHFALIVPVMMSGLKHRLASAKPGKGFFCLGTGDIVLPAIMAVSSARLGLWYGLAVLVGGLIGLTANLVIFFRQDRPLRPMPALPAPAAGAVLAHLLISIFIS